MPRRFLDLLRSARSEAQGAFGDPAVILERAILHPRHIEIQVFGDRHGNAIHLGERDCSVQRRHQKLIEEAPSPAVSPELRARMGAISVAAVQSIGYEGAGTLEFLLDGDGKFLFHGNEHAAAGRASRDRGDHRARSRRIAVARRWPASRLGCGRMHIRFSGHAIEVRLCSEDAAHDFMPQSGRMALWQMPGELRVEHALQSGSEIPPFYDSMIAKIIAHGVTRDEARRKLIHGLEHSGRVRRDHQSGVPRGVSAASGVRGGRGDHRFHRGESRRSAEPARPIRRRMWRWWRCCLS